MEQNTTQNTNKNSLAKVLAVVAILEAAAIIALLINKNQTQKETENLIQKIETGQIQKDSLNNELEKLAADYESLQTNNDTLNAQLNEQKQKVEKLIKQLRQTKAANTEEIEAYKREVETLRNIMRSYVVQIDSLNTKNELLIAENNKLKGNIARSNELNQQLTNQKDSLQGRVKEAEALKALNLKLNALNDRDNETSRVIKTKKFKLAFTISENQMTKQGAKNIYIRIIKPDGSVLMNETSAFFNYQGKEIAYSALKQTTYEGKAKTETVYAISREVLTAGTYQADIFIDGKNIGTATIKLD